MLGVKTITNQVHQLHYHCMLWDQCTASETRWSNYSASWHQEIPRLTKMTLKSNEVGGWSLVYQWTSLRASTDVMWPAATLLTMNDNSTVTTTAVMRTVMTTDVDADHLYQPYSWRQLHCKHHWHRPRAGASAAAILSTALVSTTMTINIDTDQDQDHWWQGSLALIWCDSVCIASSGPI